MNKNERTFNQNTKNAVLSEKIPKKCLTIPPFVRIIAHVDRLNTVKQNRILGICIVVVR